MRTVIYARKSTDRDDMQIQSLEDQIRECERIAARERWRVAEIYQEARSAKEPGKRPEFQRLVSDIEAGQVVRVLTWSMTRLSRNPVDGGIVAYLLQTGRLEEIRTAERSYRPEDNALLFSIENGMATAYIQDLRRNVMRGMRGKVERGWHTCKAPIGYLNDPETREIRPDPERFDLVREAWDLLLRRQLPVAEIHRILVGKGLAVRRRGSEGTPISQSGFYGIFGNAFYCGHVPFKGESLPGRHVPMVTQEEFRMAQEILGSTGKAKTPEARRMAFSGVFRCAKCGCAITGEIKRKHYKRRNVTAEYRYYFCSGSRGCGRRSVREDDLAVRAMSVLGAIRMPESTATWMEEAVFQSFEADSVGTAKSLSELARKKETEEVRLQRLNLMRLDGEITASEYAEMKGDLLSSMEKLQAEIYGQRDRAAKIMRHISARLSASVAANEISAEEGDLRVLAKALACAGPTYLNLETAAFRMDPILEKIAVFEPLRNGSERPINGDSIADFPVWWTLVEDLRNLVTDEAICADGRERALRQRYGRYSWRLESRVSGGISGGRQSLRG